MFLAAKLLAFLTQPLAWVAMLMVGAMLCLRRRPKMSQGLGWSAIALLLLIGWAARSNPPMSGPTPAKARSMMPPSA